MYYSYSSTKYYLGTSVLVYYYCIIPAERSTYTASQALQHTANNPMRFAIRLRRGQQGLGMALDASNKVTCIVPGGQADKDGLLELGDEVLSVDGVALASKPFADVINRCAKEHHAVIERLDDSMQACVENLPAGHPVKAAPNGSLELVHLTVVKDANGLGLDMNRLNVLNKVLPGGAAEKSGGWLPGDLVVAVNHEKLAGRSIFRVLPKDLAERQYKFTVFRAPMQVKKTANVHVVPPGKGIVDYATGDVVSNTTTRLSSSCSKGTATSSKQSYPSFSKAMLLPTLTLPDRMDTAQLTQKASLTSATTWSEWLTGSWSGAADVVINIDGEAYRLRTVPTRELADGISQFSARRLRDGQEVSIERHTRIAADRLQKAHDVAIRRMLSALNANSHVNIVTFYGAANVGGYFYVVSTVVPVPFSQTAPPDAAHHIAQVSELCHSQHLGMEIDFRHHEGCGFGEDEIALAMSSVSLMFALPMFKT